MQIGLELLRPHFPAVLGVRLLGITISGLDAWNHGGMDSWRSDLRQPAAPPWTYDDEASDGRRPP